MANSMIRVIKNGRPYKGARVVLDFGYLGGQTSSYYSDEEGWATITHSQAGEVTIYVDGRNLGKVKTPGNHVVNC